MTCILMDSVMASLFCQLNQRMITWEEMPDDGLPRLCCPMHTRGVIVLIMLVDVEGPCPLWVAPLLGLD